MGISIYDLSLLLQSGTNFRGSALFFGRQSVAIRLDQLNGIFRLYDKTLPRDLNVLYTNLAARGELFGHIDLETFAEALGFEDCESVDYCDFEQPDWCWDLNEPISDLQR